MTQSKSELKRHEAQGVVSYKPEVIADNSGVWAGNALRFATKEEAEASAMDLSSRWMLVREWRAAPSTDPVNYRWDAEAYKAVPIEGA